MPISQTLLLRIFPKEKHAAGDRRLGDDHASSRRSSGPILGGTISDNWGWHWIFFINMPIAVALRGVGAIVLLRQAETKTEKLPIDGVGLVLLVLWVGALQLMLDLGREHDWFGDPHDRHARGRSRRSASASS